jgi:hypothetical protein
LGRSGSPAVPATRGCARAVAGCSLYPRLASPARLPRSRQCSHSGRATPPVHPSPGSGGPPGRRSIASSGRCLLPRSSATSKWIIIGLCRKSSMDMARTPFRSLRQGEDLRPRKQRRKTRQLTDHRSKGLAQEVRQDFARCALACEVRVPGDRCLARGLTSTSVAPAPGSHKASRRQGSRG